MKSKSKFVKIGLSTLLGLVMGFLAYHFVPQSNYDLVRHWEVVDTLAPVESVNDFTKISGTIDREIIPQVYSLVIAKIGNYNLLQFFIVAIGYTALFYILFDYKDKTKISVGRFLPVFLLALFGQSMLFYFSGLYNYFAINLFALALYLDYVNKSKKIAWFLYLLVPFVHSSMFLPLLFLLIFKTKKEKISQRFILIFTIAMMLFGVFMSVVVDLLNIDFLNALKATYDSYVDYNDRMMEMYDGFYLFMSITKIAIVLVACFLQRNNPDNRKLRQVIYLIASATIVLSLTAIAFTRFSSLVLFAGLPIIMDVIKVKDKNSLGLLLSIIVLAITYTVHSIYVMAPFIAI